MLDKKLSTKNPQIVTKTHKNSDVWKVIKKTIKKTLDLSLIDAYFLRSSSFLMADYDVSNVKVGLIIGTSDYIYRVKGGKLDSILCSICDLNKDQSFDPVFFNLLEK